MQIKKINLVFITLMSAVRAFAAEQESIALEKYIPKPLADLTLEYVAPYGTEPTQGLIICGEIFGIPEFIAAQGIADEERKKINAILQKTREFYKDLYKDLTESFKRKYCKPEVFEFTDLTSFARINLVGKKSGIVWNSSGVDDILLARDIPQVLPIPFLKFFAYEPNLYLKFSHKFGNVFLELSTKSPPRASNQCSLAQLTCKTL